MLLLIRSFLKCFDYIIGAKLKSASQEVQACAIDNEGFSIMHNNEEDSISYKMMKNKLDDWIILHSTKKARKDVYDRERLIERAKETLDDARLHSKTGAKKFIKSVNKQKYELDLEKIEKEKQYDGYYALSFSDKTMSASEITDAYHSLWRIEESFRTIKSFFEVRPMFHWTPSRIHGHIMLNFIALVLQKDLELKLKSQDTNASQQAIRDAMHGMRRSIIKINRSQYYIYSKISVLAQNILQSINLKPRSNVKI
jgi:transposase